MNSDFWIISTTCLSSLDRLELERCVRQHPMGRMGAFDVVISEPFSDPISNAFRCTRCLDLTITHKSSVACFCGSESFVEVGLSREAPSHDGCSRRRIPGSVQISSEEGDGGHIECEIPCGAFSAGWHFSFEQGAFCFGEYRCGCRCRGLAAENGQPRNSPGHDAA